MAEAPNTTGAPTEGLGQTVTFQFDPQNVPQLQLPNQVAGVSGDIRGGNIRTATEATPIRMERNPTLDAVLALGGQVLKGYADKAKMDNYFRGMQEAATGRSIQEVANDRPWFSRIFGDGDAVEGARAYTQQAKAAEVTMAIEEALPNMAHMSPGEARAEFQKHVQAGMTGDSAADGHLMMGMTRMLPSAFKAQAKMHLAYVQSQAAQAFTASMDRTGKLLANRADLAAGGFLTPEDMQREAQGLIALSIAPNGMEEKVWQQTMASKLHAWGQAGNLHAVAAFTDAGILEHLTSDQAASVKSAVAHGERVQREKFSMARSNDMIDIKLMAQRPPTATSSRDLAAKIDALNHEFQITSGSSQWMIGPNEREALITHNALAIDSAIRADMLARSKAVDKVQATLDKASAINEAIMQGRVKNLILAGGATSKEADQRAVSVLAGMAHDAQADVLHSSFRSDGYVFDLISDQKVRSVTQAIKAGQGGYDAKAFETVYGDWARLNAIDPTLASAYYKDKHADLTRFQETLASTKSPTAAFQAAFVDKHRGKVDKKTLEATVKTVVKEESPFAASFRPGVYALEPYAAKVAASVIGPEVERRTAGTLLDDKVIASGILKEKLASGELEVLGGHLLTSTLDNKKPFAAWLSDEAWKTRGAGVSTDDVHSAFRKTIDAKLFGENGAAGVVKPTGLFGNPKITHAAMMRTADVGGVPMLQVHVTTDDGQTVNFPLSGQEVIDKYTGSKPKPGQHLGGRIDRSTIKPIDQLR